MGTLIKAKGVDASKWASEVILPVMSGLKGVFLFRDNVEKFKQNMAPGGQQGATVVGNPTVSADGKYGTFQSSVNYIQTAFDEPKYWSVYMVYRSLTAIPPTQPSSESSILWGNYAVAPNTESSGSVIWTPYDYGISSNASRVTAEGVNQNSGVTLSYGAGNPLVKQWSAISARCDGTRNYVGDAGRNLVATSNTFLDRFSPMSTRKIRLCSGYSGAQTGKHDVAAIIQFDRMLTDAEDVLMKAWVLAYARRQGLIA